MRRAPILSLLLSLAALSAQAELTATYEITAARLPELHTYSYLLGAKSGDKVEFSPEAPVVINLKKAAAELLSGQETITAIRGDDAVALYQSPKQASRIAWVPFDGSEPKLATLALEHAGELIDATMRGPEAAHAAIARLFDSKAGPYVSVGDPGPRLISDPEVIRKFWRSQKGDIAKIPGVKNSGVQNARIVVLVEPSAEPDAVRAELLKALPDLANYPLEVRRAAAEKSLPPAAAAAPKAQIDPELIAQIKEKRYPIRAWVVLHGRKDGERDRGPDFIERAELLLKRVARKTKLEPVDPKILPSDHAIVVSGEAKFLEALLQDLEVKSARVHKP